MCEVLRYAAWRFESLGPIATDLLYTPDAMNDAPAFRFERRDVSVTTTDEVRAMIESGRSCLVHGQRSSGKTHAVRKAVNGAAWIDLEPDLAQVPSFFLGLARECPEERGQELLEALGSESFDQAFELAGTVLGDRTLIVDRAEYLDQRPAADWSNPLAAITTGAQQALRGWLQERAKSAPTILVSRRRAPEATNESPFDPVRHSQTKDWHIKLAWAEDGFRDWKGLADAVGDLPGGLSVGAALVPLLGAEEFDHLLGRLESEQDSGPYEAIRTLVRTFHDCAPTRWCNTLALLRALDGGEGAVLRDELPQEEADALEALVDLELVKEDRHGRLQPIRILVEDTRLGPVTTDAQHHLLTRMASVILSQVNNRTSLHPLDADRVYRAHRLYLEVGDFENAQRTARLYLHGLIDLARHTSLEGECEAARQQYASIRSLLGDRPAPGDSGARTYSYVLHYHAYNGRRADTLPSDVVLDEYTEATELWSENALWHQRRIETLIELGNAVDAEAAIGRAYAEVPSHPCKDTFLRVRPAQTALHSGAPVLSMETIEPVLERLLDRSRYDIDPEGRTAAASLARTWKRGFEVRELRHAGGMLWFQGNEVIRLDPLTSGWLASLTALEVQGRGTKPSEATRSLADRIASETSELLQIPSHRLDDEHLRRKSLLLVHVDPLNSDLGIDHVKERWLLGRLDEGYFVPVHSDYESERLLLSSSIPASRRPEKGLVFGRVSVSRDGRPHGEVQEIEPAGSGRSLRELIEELAALGEATVHG